MRPFTLLFLVFVSAYSIQVHGQGNPPWERPLRMAKSGNGATFGPNTIFQDSSGVPSAIRLGGDTLICAFQWFRQPNPSPSWDRVAVKFSYDDGATWTQPTPIVIAGFPGNYQRPFDPTLLRLPDGRIRIYFSSSNGMPLPGQDSIIDTHSACGWDGINYNFEPNPRYNNPNKKVIDPAVVIFNGTYHLTAPIGAPQDGAYHLTSSDGIGFVRVADIPSDPQHNWTGNFVEAGPNDLRFYGAGPNIWYNSTSDVVSWPGYVPTNISGGGDPTVVKKNDGSYLIIYVGQPYTTAVEDGLKHNRARVYPNPAASLIGVDGLEDEFSRYEIFSVNGQLMQDGEFDFKQRIDVSGLNAGCHVLRLWSEERVAVMRFVR